MSEPVPTRVRSRGGMSLMHRNWLSYDTNGHLQPHYCNYYYGQSVGTEESIADVPHPGFKQRMKNGEIILSPMSKTRIEQWYSPTHFVVGPHDTWGTAVYEGEWTTYWSGAVDYGQMPVGDAMSIALIEAYAKMKASPLLIGETLKDLDSTVGMLRRPFGGARDLIRKMDKYRLRHLGKTVASGYRAASNAWLEYRYGWKPLILDCQTTIDLCTKVADKDSGKLLVARASQSRSFDRTITVDRAAGNVNVAGPARLTKSYVASAGVLYRADKAYVEALDAKLGYRPSDLAVTFWESIPYSFVVDWFVNVGDWVQAIVPVPGINIVGNWITTVDKTREIVGPLSVNTTVDNGLVPAKTYYGSSGIYGRNLDQVTRVVNRPLPTWLSWKGNPLPKNNQIDAMALSCKQVIAAAASFASHLQRKR